MKNKGFKLIAGTILLVSCVFRNYNNNTSEEKSISAERSRHVPGDEPNRMPQVGDGRSTNAKAIVDKEANRFANSIFRLYDNHNETYFKIKTMLKDGRLKPNNEYRTVIHFDNHADLYRSDAHLDGVVDIGNYINTMIWKGQVDTVYWIIPDITESKKQIPNQPAGCGDVPNFYSLYWGRPNELVDWQFRDGPADQLICVALKETRYHREGSFEFHQVNKPCAEGYRTVKFHKRVLGSFIDNPNAKIPGRTILDVDLDYFDNSGRYANYAANSPWTNLGPGPRCYNLHWTPHELDVELERFMTAITQSMDLRPDFIGASRSPGYMVQNTNQIENFFTYLGSKTKDSASSYE